MPTAQWRMSAALSTPESESCSPASVETGSSTTKSSPSACQLISRRHQCWAGVPANLCLKRASIRSLCSLLMWFFQSRLLPLRMNDSLCLQMQSYMGVGCNSNATDNADPGNHRPWFCFMASSRLSATIRSNLFSFSTNRAAVPPRNSPTFRTVPSKSANISSYLQGASSQFIIAYSSIRTHLRKSTFGSCKWGSQLSKWSK